MASAEDAETNELNFIFKSLGERGQSTVTTMGSLGLMQKIGSAMGSLSNSIPLIKIYGSVAEDLKSYKLEDFVRGDVDVMMIPQSNSLMIHDELIEYLPENPLFVRIKGVDHPVLRSCLVENTEYVATSALKNFHPAIYGPFVNLSFSRYFPTLSQAFAASNNLFLHTKNNKTSPALTVNYAVPFGSISEQFDGLKAYDEYLNEAKTEIESKSQDEGRIRSENLSAVAAMFNSPKMCVTSENCQEVESAERNTGNGSHGTFLSSSASINRPHPRNGDANRESAASFCQLSTRESQKRSYEVPEKRMSDKSDENINNGGPIENRLEPKIELETKETKLEETGNGQLQQPLGGSDFVPALKSPEWPKVAEEWIRRRDRKWPSPDVVDKVIQEGFHLVVKPPKNGGNPDCDFRISFSHAEYLLSQEMNDIQRECYRCLKKFHRAYLSTVPEGLVSYHLKNILLQTIEETGAEMWSESNRVECVMKLLSNLLKALTRRNLPHFFVRSYNLFCVDYFDDAEILESLARKVEHIMERPMGFAKELFQKQVIEGTAIRESLGENVEHVFSEQGLGNVFQELQQDGPAKTCTWPGTGLTTNIATGQGHEAMEGIAPTQNEEELFTTTLLTSVLPLAQKLIKGYPRHQELKDSFLATSKKLADIAFEGADCSLEDLDPIERLIVEDLREMQKCRSHKDINFMDEMLSLFNIFSDVFLLYTSPGLNTKRCVLSGLQSCLKMYKYASKHDDPADDEDPFNLINIFTTDLGPEPRFTQPPEADTDDIPLD